MLHITSSAVSLAADHRWELYKVLADPQRLRLLALAEAEELAIGELAELLGESQSNVSRQLSPLRRLGLVAERKQGTRVFIRLAPEFEPDPVVRDALASGRRLCQSDGVLDGISDVIRRRDAAAREFFGRHRGDGDEDSSGDFPPELPAYLAAVAPLIPERRLAIDVGTGDGRLLEVLAPLFERVIGVDREAAQLELAGERLRRRGYRNVSLVAADLQVPEALAKACPAGQADVVFAARMLHHAPRPSDMLAALAGLVAPGGSLVVLDYAPHQDERLREDQADLWLGFSSMELLSHAARAGLVDAHVGAVPGSFCGAGPDAHLPWHILFARRPAQPLRIAPSENLNGDNNG